MGDVLRIPCEETNDFGGAPRCTPISDGKTEPDPMALSIVIRARLRTARFHHFMGFDFVTAASQGLRR